MFKKFIFALTVIFINSMPSVLQAQQLNMEEPEKKESQNVIYLELFGNGLVYTINYERLVFDDYYLRAGGGYLSIRYNGDKFTAYSIPIMLNRLIGRGNAKLELGAGLVITNFDVGFKDDVETNHEGMTFRWYDLGITSTIGYRHLFNNGGVFRIGIQPRYLFGSEFSESLSGFGVTPGISFGAAF